MLGCITLTLLNEIVLRELGLEQGRPLAYGLILILSVLFLPQGLEGVVERLAAWRRRRSHTEVAR